MKNKKIYIHLSLLYEETFTLYFRGCFNSNKGERTKTYLWCRSYWILL